MVIVIVLTMTWVVLVVVVMMDDIDDGDVCRNNGPIFYTTYQASKIFSLFHFSDMMMTCSYRCSQSEKEDDCSVKCCVS